MSGPPPPDCADHADPHRRHVAGERGTALVSAVRSLHSRASSALAAILMIGLGLSALTWYYAHAFGRQTRARENAQASTAVRARAEMALPALGPVRAPPPPPADGAPVPAAAAPADRDLPQAEAAAAPLPAGTAAATATKTPGQLAYERRLAGLVFARDSAAPAAPTLAAAVPAGGAAAAPGAGGLGALLVPTVAAATLAQRAPDSRFLMPKGAFVDCTLETAIDSTLPGMTTCITASDTFGADGKVVLLERGSKLVGETRGQVQLGQARLFVLWTQARTPAGVIIPFDSPGTDELGRAGVTGEVQRHFWQRFGAALLISVIDGGVQAGVRAASGGQGAVIYAPAGSQDVLTGALKDSAQIAPTISIRNGEPVQVLVARDVDFRSVYELHVDPVP